MPTNLENDILFPHQTHSSSNSQFSPDDLAQYADRFPSSEKREGFSYSQSGTTISGTFDHYNSQDGVPQYVQDQNDHPFRYDSINLHVNHCSLYENTVSECTKSSDPNANTAS